MNVRVDESGRHQLAGGVDSPVDFAAETPADVDDAIALEHDLAVAYQRVSALLVTDQPSCIDFRAQGFGPARSATAVARAKCPSADRLASWRVGRISVCAPARRCQACAGLLGCAVVL